MAVFDYGLKILALIGLVAVAALVVAWHQWQDFAGLRKG